MILPPRFSCSKQNKEGRLGFPLVSNIWGLWEVNRGEGRRLKVAFVDLKDMCTCKEESIWEPLETTERFIILRKLGEVAQILLLLRYSRNSSEILGVFQDCQDISELHEIHCQMGSKDGRIGERTIRGIKMKFWVLIAEKLYPNCSL